jgi:hypothetical protein
MKNDKGFIGLGLILAIITVLAIGGVAYYVGTKKVSAPQNIEENSNQILPSNSFEVPTGPFLDESNYVPPEPLCNSNTDPWIKVISPNGGEVYSLGQKMEVKWETCNVADAGIFIEVYNPKTTALTLIDDIDNGIENDGSEMIVLSTSTNASLISGEYELRIYAGSFLDYSDKTFILN